MVDAYVAEGQHRRGRLPDADGSQSECLFRVEGGRLTDRGEELLSRQLMLIVRAAAIVKQSCQF